MAVRPSKEKTGLASNVPRLSRKEEFILAALIRSRRELFGLEIVESSGGELKRGTIYVTLQRMQEKGFIDSRREARPAPEIGIPLRLYKVTGLGQRVFLAYQATRPSLSLEAISAGT